MNVTTRKARPVEGPYLVETVKTAMGRAHRIFSSVDRYHTHDVLVSLYEDGVCDLKKDTPLRATAHLMGAAPDLIRAMRTIADSPCRYGSPRSPCTCIGMDRLSKDAKDLASRWCERCIAVAALEQVESLS